MTAEIALPATSTATQGLIFEMQAKRGPLSEAIEAAAARRRSNSALAGLGNAAAKAEVDRAEDDEKQARVELRHLDDAVAALEGHRDALIHRELEQERAAHEAQRTALADKLLAVDDDIDAAVDRLTELLGQRRELITTGRFFDDPEHRWQLLNALADHLQPALPVQLDRRSRRFISDIDGYRLQRRSRGSIARGAQLVSPLASTLTRALLGEAPRSEAPPFGGDMVLVGRTKDGDPRYAFQRADNSEQAPDRPLWKLKPGVSHAYLGTELRQMGERWNEDEVPDLELCQPANEAAKAMIGVV